MSVSKDQDAADKTAAPDASELTASQLDQVSGGDPVVTQTTVNKQVASQKAADKADALIRS